MRAWSRPALWWRAGIAVSAALGLVLGRGSLVYFTIDSNVMVLGYFLGAVYWMLRGATADALAPRLRGAVVLYSAITALVAHFVLNHGTDPLPGLVTGPDRLSQWSDFFLHYVTPVLVLLDWLLLPPRTASRWRDIPLWLSFPLGYAALVLARAAAFTTFPIRYPYPFLDPTTRGYGYVFGQVVVLTIEFTVLAAAVVGLDRAGTRLRRLLHQARAKSTQRQ
jgi:hypothetical protein